MMDLSMTKDEFLLIRYLIEQECGIAVEEEKVYLLESRLLTLVLENGCTTFGEFYLKVKADTEGLKEKVVDAMTTNETLWFRDEGPFVVLKERLFPELHKEIELGNKRNVRIWSAACSTGQEPYSIALTALQTRLSRLVDANLSILATDISPSALKVAKSAKYNPIAISRGLPAELKDQYFENAPPSWILKDEVKNKVEFKPFNLQNSFSSLGKFDVIMLRNVAIYFSHSFKVDLFTRLAQSLNPGGYLFLGASESLLGYNDDFKTLEHGRFTFYQLKD